MRNFHQNKSHLGFLGFLFNWQINSSFRSMIAQDYRDKCDGYFSTLSNIEVFALLLLFSTHTWNSKPKKMPLNPLPQLLQKQTFVAQSFVA